MAEAVDASRRGTPERRIADQKIAREDACSRLQQSIERQPSSLGKGMGRRGEINALTGQHLQLLGSVAKPLEVRQVGMEIECRHTA
jgi:hypothetical protein